ESDHELRQICAYGLVYELSKNQRNKDLTDAFFLGVIARIKREIGEAEGWVRGSMAGALIGIGKRNLKLNKEAVKLAKRISPVDYSSCGGSCEPIDVMKHIASDSIKKKLGV
ncbi:hypothetical protein N9B94_00875, partial [Verrucomicrobia bacterium]|nr:hypothetical protein [Verrucomicrobiota bacterium]